MVYYQSSYHVYSVFWLIEMCRRIIRRQISVDRRRLDQQLTAMIFVRIISHTILTLPYIIYRIYSLNMTMHRNAVNQLILFSCWFIDFYQSMR